MQKENVFAGGPLSSNDARQTTKGFKLVDVIGGQKGYVSL